METAGNTAEGELAANLAVEGDVSGLHHVEKVLVPQLHLGDPPFTDQRALRRTLHVASRSLGYPPRSRDGPRGSVPRYARATLPNQPPSPRRAGRSTT